MKNNFFYFVILICFASRVLGHSKVLVALGYRGYTVDDVEIFDLFSTSNTSTCQKLPNFPFANYWAAGGLGFDDKPVICGGNKNKYDCHVFDNGVWEKTWELGFGRYAFAMTRSPFQDGSKLFVTGGFNGFLRLKFTEVYTETGWEPSWSTPVEISYHCMVLLNSSSVMIIGGTQDDEVSGNTFIFTAGEYSWTEGPTLEIARNRQSCGMIGTDEQTSDKTVIAVGGEHEEGILLSSTEVLERSSNQWRRGPDLPFPICCAAIVEDPSGGVILIGGYSNIGHLDTFYKLPHAGQGAAWEKMPQTLEIPRDHVTAFLVPDELTDCEE